jgi:hypothetical protein
VSRRPGIGHVGRGWARTGVGAGAAVSIAANVLSTFIRPDDQPESWTPHLGAVVGAVWWPVSLFLALEVLVSSRWGSSRWWLALRLCATAPVAAVAAFVSYQHLSRLLDSWGEDSFTVGFGPVAVDGLMVVCSAALYRMRTPAVGVGQAALADAVEPLDSAVGQTAPAGLDMALDKLREQVLDSVRGELATATQHAPRPAPVSKRTASRAKRPVAARPKRSEEFAEAVRRMTESGVARSTANHRAGRAEADGILDALLAEYPPVHPVAAQSG